MVCIHGWILKACLILPNDACHLVIVAEQHVLYQLIAIDARLLREVGYANTEFAAYLS